jgi:hypothetical protein
MMTFKTIHNTIINTDEKAIAMYKTSNGINSNIKKALLNFTTS